MRIGERVHLCQCLGLKAEDLTVKRVEVYYQAGEF